MLGVIPEKMVRLDEEDTLLRLSMAGLARRIHTLAIFDAGGQALDKSTPDPTMPLFSRREGRKV
jgi:hypothetical protein